MPRDIHISNPSFLHLILNRELDELYLAIALRFFALSMIGIFLPVYLFFVINLSLPIVMYFFIVFALAFIPSSFISAKIASRIGFKHVILLSAPFMITFFFLLILLSSSNIPLFLIAIIGAFSHALYWIGHHADLARFTVRKVRGQEVGLAFFVNAVGTIIGPLVGGLILAFFNFTVLFVTGSLILLISTVPLFFSKEFYEKANFSMTKVFSRGSLKDAAAFTAQGIGSGASSILWPLYIFSILGKFFSLGLVGTLSGVVAAFSSILAGKLSDKVGKRVLIRLGSFGLIALWFFRTLVKTISQVYFVTIFIFIPIMAFVPTDTLTYSKARFSRRIVEYLVFREIFINFGRIIVYTVMLVTASYIATFIFTGISQVLLILL